MRLKEISPEALRKKIEYIFDATYLLRITGLLTATLCWFMPPFALIMM
jgi:hypothetical protein